MNKGAEAFRSIGEVAKLIGVAPHVLRYWETQFPQLRPMKRPDGRRYYRPDDVRLVAGLCELLRDEGLTIRGALKQLSQDKGAGVRARGTARLADLFGAVPQPAIARPEPVPADADADADTGPLAPAHAETVAADALPTGPAHAGLPVGRDDQPHSDADQTDPVPSPPTEEEPPQMSSNPASRSRHRRRRHGPADGGLPLFPDLDGAGQQAVWLSQLARMTGRLRDIRHSEPRWQAARPAALRLAQAIVRLY